MRARGAMCEPVDLRRGDHLCWPYDDADDFEAAALRYVAEGLMVGERVLCIVEQSLRSSLLKLEPAIPAPATGPALQVMTLEQVYDTGSPRTPEQQLEFYDAVTVQALADGYTGLRVLADATDLMLDPSRWSTHVRWEHLADRYMASGAGLSAMCAYRTDRLAPAAIDDVACVHPLGRDAARGNEFRLFFDERGGLVLAGAVDSFCADRLAGALAHIQPRDGQIVLDVGALEFIDVRGASVLAHWAHRLGRESASVHLTHASPLLQRIWDIAGFSTFANVTVTGPR